MLPRLVAYLINHMAILLFNVGRKIYTLAHYRDAARNRNSRNGCVEVTPDNQVRSINVSRAESKIRPCRRLNPRLPLLVSFRFLLGIPECKEVRVFRVSGSQWLFITVYTRIQLLRHKLLKQGFLVVHLLDKRVFKPIRKFLPSVKVLFQFHTKKWGANPPHLLLFVDKSSSAASASLPYFHQANVSCTDG